MFSFGARVYETRECLLVPSVLAADWTDIQAAPRVNVSCLM